MYSHSYIELNCIMALIGYKAIHPNKVIMYSGIMGLIHNFYSISHPLGAVTTQLITAGRMVTKLPMKCSHPAAGS